MKLNLAAIPPPPDWWDKEKLIAAIVKLSPPDIVIRNHPMLTVSVSEGGLWNENALRKFSEWDLIVVFRVASITEEQVTKKEE